MDRFSKRGDLYHKHFALDDRRKNPSIRLLVNQSVVGRSVGQSITAVFDDRLIHRLPGYSSDVSPIIRQLEG
ncbi:unnamed protein product [Soboliphyme baturini]|uniref:Transposase n=1 Tax=Soboliphyme baturini TaxID=241478 RepID=A0A183IP57_9BILA|nr:unnamed protein product [Soboliphyme baturini]